MIQNRQEHGVIGGMVFRPIEGDMLADFDFIDNTMLIHECIEEFNNIFAVEQAGLTMLNAAGESVSVADNFARLQHDGLVIANESIELPTATIPFFYDGSFTVIIEAELVSDAGEDSTLIQFSVDGHTENSVRIYYDQDYQKFVTEITENGVISSQIIATNTTAAGTTVTIAVAFSAV